METKEYYRGYLRVNNTKEYIKKINNEFKFFVYSDNHIYDVVKETECYDQDGIYLGFYKNENKGVTRSEEKEIKKDLSVIQYNYNFYLLPLGYVSTIDEMDSAYRLINSIFKIKEINNYRESFDREIAIDRFYNNDNERNYRFNRDYTENFLPFEIVKLGFSREIRNVTYKKLFDLDIKKYTERKNDFIKKHPEFKDSVEYIYKVNIGHLSLFWDVPKKALLKDNFNRNIESIKKLNRKITNKQKQL